MIQDHSFVPGGARKTVTVGLLMTSVTTSFLAIFTGFLSYRHLSRLAGGEEIGQDVADFVDLADGCVALLSLPVMIGCAVAFCMWFHRVHKNLPALGAEYLQYTPARAVASFFIPFVNLIRPLHVAEEIFSASDPEVDRDFLEREKQPAWIGQWWLFFILSNLVGNLGGRFYWRAETPQALATATMILIVGDFLSIIAGVLAIKLVQTIDLRQTRRHRALAERAAEAPPPVG